MDTTTELTNSAAILALLISFIRDPAVLSFFTNIIDIFKKKHNPEDLVKIEKLTLEVNELLKEKEINEAIALALDNPELNEKAARIRKVMSKGVHQEKYKEQV